MGFLDSLGKTLKSAGGAALAGPGAIYDIATTMVPGDQWGGADDGTAGDLLDALGSRFGQVTDPFTNSSTWSGYGLQETMHALDWAYKNGVDEPLSTAVVMWHDVGPGGGWQFGQLLDGDEWANAYDVAQHQNLGQTIMAGGTSNDMSDYSGKKQRVETEDGEIVEVPLTPFLDTIARDHPFIANAGALAINLGASWFLDPAVAAGKAASLSHQYAGLGKLTEGNRVTGVEQLLNSDKSGLFGRDWAGRWDRYFAYINGDNKLSRPLNGAEIFAITPELRRSSAGRAIAGALGSSLRIDDVAERENAARRVLTIATGDVGQIDRLRSEIGGTAAISDALSNLTKGATLNLAKQAVYREARWNPVFNAELAAQVENLDAADDVTKFVSTWAKQTDDKLKAQKALMDLQGRLDFVPSTHAGTAGKLRKTQGKAALDRVSGAHDATLDAARRMANRESYTNIFQKSLYHVPLAVAHPVGWLAAPLTRGLPGAVRGLQQVHFNGVVSLHDWEGASDQLDSMMRIAKVNDDVRLNELSRAFTARTEVEKVRAIERVEQVAMRGLADHLSERFGKKVDPGFIKATMLEGQRLRGKDLGRFEGGRIYAATLQPEEMAAGTRAGLVAGRVSDTADSQATARRSALAEVEKIKPRVDQIVDESGLPLAVPLTTTQLANRVPLFDMDRAVKLSTDAMWRERFAAHSDMWNQNVVELGGLMSEYFRARGAVARRLEKAISTKRAVLDGVLDASSAMNRWWKMSVLFRLGYPMRVLSDDHMRIASRIGYGPFLGASAPDAWKNLGFNMVGRRKIARAELRELRIERTRLLGDQALLTDLQGRRAISDGEWAKYSTARKAFYNGKATKEERAAARRVMRQVDPYGHVDEYYDLQNQADKAAASIRGLKGALTRHRNAGKGELAARVEQRIAEREGELSVLQEMMNGRVDPEELRKQLFNLERTLKQGPKALRPEKRRIGENEVALGDGVKAAPLYDSSFAAYRTAASSDQSFQAIISDGEESAFNLISSGMHRTIRPDEPGHLSVWANVLNHQFQHSPELMAFVRGKVQTPEEFASWVRKPENRHLLDRMEQYAHDPVGWGSRLQELFHDYVPDERLRELVAEGRVSAKQLDKLFPPETRPSVHGQLADVNTGRNAATRYMSNTIGRWFKYLSDVPTDRLSRHPYMNAVYKREVREAYNVRKAYRAKQGGEFTPEDLAEIERMARQKALGELKQTLWDVSAHSHAAHTMRFLSPFMAAHQEALTRWWHIARDDPSIVRRFQLAFDAPRKAGLTYNPDTGEVQPGDSIGEGNQIMIRLPFADDNNAVNKWLKKMGGGKYWRVSEQGLNLILQNGLANPGVGPIVTIPTEYLAQKYANEPNLTKMARVLNQYPTQGHSLGGIAIGALTPAWANRVRSMTGANPDEYGRYYMQNMADNLIGWREAHPDEPVTDDIMDSLAEKTAHETHRDLALMAISNVASITPAKPESKYYLVQHGLTRLKEQMRQQGEDYDWLREQFAKQYGDIYLAMVYSMGDNPGRLDQTGAEVGAMKRYRGLLDKIDPSLTRMVIGPAAAMDAETDPELSRYSDTARSFLEATKTRPGGEETYLGSKSVDEASLKILVNEGWEQYEQLVNYLDVQADQLGLDTYEQSEQLVAAKKAGLDHIKANNFAFRNDYDSYSAGGYEKKVDDMRQIVSSAQLNSDPTRGDVYWVGQYLALRDTINGMLAQRAAGGGAKTLEAKANADLSRAFKAGMTYIYSQAGSYFRMYSYAGIIEQDPMLNGMPELGDE